MPRGQYERRPRLIASDGDDLGPPGVQKRRKKRKARKGKLPLGELLNAVATASKPAKIEFVCNQCSTEIPVFPVTFCPWCGVKFDG